MKRKRTSALGTSMTKSHLRALDRLGLPKPVLSIVVGQYRKLVKCQQTTIATGTGT